MQSSYGGDVAALSAPDIEMDRRRFLALLGSLIAAGTLAACGPQVPSPSRTAGLSTPGPSPDSDPRFDILRKLRAIIRESPDHLAAIADAAVATGDPVAITRFVRDSIAVLPATSSGADAGTDVRWGHRAALRAGAGTLRERADLLADLLHRAGIESRIVTIPRLASYQATQLLVPTFAPDPVAIGSLWDPVAPTHPPVGQMSDTAGSRADRATERLLAALPLELRSARLVAPPIPDTVPAVEYVQDGATRWTAALGNALVITSAPAGLLGADDAVVPRVSVAVSVALNPPAGAVIDRTVLHEVLRGEWGADEVAGRQLVLAFATPGAPADALRRDHATAPIRQPILRLEAADALGDTVPFVSGKYLSMAGGLVEISPGDPHQVVGPLGPMAAAAPAGAGPVVAALVGTALVATFPNIELHVQALRTDGNPVDGLSASDFHVTEDGAARTVTVSANTRPLETRVLVVYDTSGSVTDFWGNSGRRAEFEATLAGALGDAARTHPFVVQVIGVGDTAAEDGWLPPDPASLGAAFGSVASNSDVWLTLGRSVPASGAAVVLLVSDNKAHDIADDVPRFRQALRASGVPVACVPVGTVDEGTTGLILADSGGARFDVAAPDVSTKLGTFIADRVESSAVVNYRLRYHALATGPSTRSVRVTVAGSTAPPIALAYVVPEVGDRAAPSGIAGVYLTIRVGDHESRRRLGGVRASDRGVPDDTADGPAIDDAVAVLDGLHTISFEPAFATTAHLLDDVIGAVLSAEPVEKAWTDGPAAIIGAGRDWHRVPATLSWLAEPVPGGTAGAAVPDGLRVTVLSDRAGSRGLVQVSDVVPGLNRSVGTGADAAGAFRSAMRATIGASVRESEVFGSSAAGQLDGAEFVVIPATTSADLVTRWTSGQRASLSPMIDEYADFHRLVPASGAVAAMWVVDPDTGSVTAVDAEGRGGGTLLPDCLTPADTNEASAFITVSVALISAACLAVGGDPSFGCVGADTFGAVSAGLAVFTAAPDIPSSAFGAASYGAGLAAANIESAAGRTIISVLLLIAGLLVGGKC